MRFVFLLAFALFLLPTPARADQFDDAATALKTKAEQGDRSAQQKLGGLYLNGQGMKQDCKKGVFWRLLSVSTAPNLNVHALPIWVEASADCAKGFSVEQGRALVQQVRKWKPMTALAVALGPADTKSLVDAKEAFDREDYRTALKLLLPLADRGNAKAQHGLGIMYDMGWGVKEDRAEAAKWYGKYEASYFSEEKVEAEKGNAEAQGTLGGMYEMGNGGKRNHAEAMKWWHKAAEQGDRGSQYSLGSMYYVGDGVGEDWVEANFWWSLASSGGPWLGPASEQLTPDQRAAVNRRVAEWLKTHPAQGPPFKYPSADDLENFW